MREPLYSWIMKEQYFGADINEALFLVLVEDAVCCWNITSQVFFLKFPFSVNMTRLCYRLRHTYLQFTEKLISYITFPFSSGEPYAIFLIPTITNVWKCFITNKLSTTWVVVAHLKYCFVFQSKHKWIFTCINTVFATLGLFGVTSKTVNYKPIVYLRYTYSKKYSAGLVIWISCTTM